MKKLYTWLTKYIHTFIFAAYLITGIVLMTPNEWWLLRVSIVWTEVAMVMLMAVGTHKKWPRYGDVEEGHVSNPTDNTLHTIELAGEDMSLSEAIKVMEEGDWRKVMPDNTSSRAVYDVTTELYEAQEIAVEAMKRGLGQWIPVAERTPTSLDANSDNSVLAIHKASDKRYYHWRTVADNPFDFSHWMKVPNDP